MFSEFTHWGHLPLSCCWVHLLFHWLKDSLMSEFLWLVLRSYSQVEDTAQFLSENPTFIHALYHSIIIFKKNPTFIYALHQSLIIFSQSAKLFLVGDRFVYLQLSTVSISQFLQCNESCLFVNSWNCKKKLYVLIIQ